MNKKERIRTARSLYEMNLESLGLMFLETIPAVDWPPLCRLERDLGLLSAVRTCRLMHLSGPAEAAPPKTSIFFHSYLLSPFSFMPFWAGIHRTFGYLKVRVLGSVIKSVGDPFE